MDGIQKWMKPVFNYWYNGINSNMIYFSTDRVIYSLSVGLSSMIETHERKNNKTISSKFTKSNKIIDS